MTKLLALIDGSIYSESVCDYAAWVAGRCTASVELMHVLGRSEASIESANLSGSIGLGARSALLEELAELDAQTARLTQKRGRAILEDAEARLRKAGVASVTTKLRHGTVVDALEEFESEFDLIFIGKRGEAADFAELHLGSNLERVLRASDKPVLVASRNFKPVNNFLIAFDGHANAVRAVEHIAQSETFAGLHCELLAVDDSTQVKRKLEGAAALLRESGYEVNTVIKPGQVETVISDYVDANAIDLLVMGAYSHSRIRNLFIGSTTTEVIRACQIPLLMFR